MEFKLKKIENRKPLKEYTFLGCSMTRNRTPWCFRICLPDTSGKGHCGRLAPHSIKSRIQLSIEAFEKRSQF